jgi:hypothetical protein
MTIKIDGTNGVIQAYDYQVLTTGFSYTFASGVQTLLIKPAATLATGTITMPAAPVDGMVITVESTQQVTAVTLQGNTGQSLIGAPVQLIANQPLSFMYRLTDTTWYPLAGGAGRATTLVAGTSQATTSGTSIDFTGIPSWVERITVMLNAVSTSGSSVPLIQLGTSSGVTTTGYTSFADSSYGAGAIQTAGFGIERVGGASVSRIGVGVITNISGNNWVFSYNGVQAGSAIALGAGAVSLAATLDRIRITTVGGADTFDAGSINILYE